MIQHTDLAYLDHPAYLANPAQPADLAYVAYLAYLANPI